MGHEMYLSDNSGNRVAPYGAINPKTATGQQLTNAAADTDTVATVTAGTRYAVTALNTGGFTLGIADVTTVANVMWVCPLHETIIIQIPVGYTMLHYAADTNDSIAYLRELADD